MPKANRKPIPRRRAPATPVPYSFTVALNEALATHPDAAIFTAVAEYKTAWAAAIELEKQARAAARRGYPSPSIQEAGRRAMAAEKRLLTLAPATTTPEGVMTLQQAAYGLLPSCGGIHAVARAAINAAVTVGL